MKRPQIILIVGGIVLLTVLVVFGKISPSSKSSVSSSAAQPMRSNDAGEITIEKILAQAKQKISAVQQQHINAIEQQAANENNNKAERIADYRQLAVFWRDSVNIAEPYIYYTAEAAKLENSEKNLNFAARLLVDNMLMAENPAIQHWLATQAKVLLDRSLVINPNNDSAKIDIGACYMFGSISDNPMQGILKVREIVQQHPDNLYAHYILGLGGKKSGQYDKAMEHFTTIINRQPNNMEAAFQLAECAELKGDKATAVKWYQHLQQVIPNPEIKQEIAQRIKSLQ